MSEKKEKIFADGFIFKRKENAPDFVVGSLSVKVNEAVEFLKSNTNNGWVNLDIKLSQGGKHYIELNTFKPEASKASNDDVPF